MSMDKKIAIVATVDEASFGRAKAKLAELVNEVKKLAEASKEVNLGGILGGVGNNRRIAGTGSQSVGQKTQAQTQNFTVGGVDNLQKTAQSFKSAGDAAKSALRGMSDSFKEHIGVSTREGQKLTKELADLERALGRVQKAASGLKGIGGGMGSPGGSGFSGGELASISTPGGRAVGHAKAAGGWSVPGMGGFDKAGNAMATRAGYAPGGMASSIGGIGAAVGAVIGAANFAMGQRQELQMSNLGYAADHQPFLASSRAATYGQIFGGNAQAIRRGDLARSAVMGDIARGQGIGGIIGSQRQMFQKFLIDKGTPTSFMSDPTLGNGYTQVKQWLGQKTNSGVDKISQFFAGDVEIPGLSNKTVNEVKARMSKDFMASRSAEDFQRIVDQQMQADPMRMARLNEQYGNAFSEIGIARTAGLGGGVVTRPDGTRYDTIKSMNARFMRSGYSASEGAQMMATVGSTAGRGLMHQNTLGLMSAQAGGFGNAVSMYGLGAQFGGGGTFFRGLQGMIGGKAALDVTAGSQLFGAAGAQMTAGTFAGSGAGSGLGFMQTLSDAAYGGSSGSDMLGVRQVTSGIGATNAMMGGSIDPLQQALNFSAALKAAPNANYGTHKGLLGLDLATASDIVATGKVPEGLRARGITVDLVKGYISEQNKTSFARATDKMFGNSEVGSALGRYRQSGGLGYLKGKSSRAVNKELSALAEALSDSTGVDRTSAMGRLRIQAAGTDGVLAKVKGRGAHDPVSRSSTAMLAAGVAGSYEQDDSLDRGKNLENTNADIGNMRGTTLGQEQARKTAQRFNDANDPDAALVGVTAALETFIRSLKNMNSGVKGMVRAGPPKS